MKTKYILSTAFAALTLQSCNLDFNPTDSIANSTLTEEDYQYLLVGVYNGAQQFSMGIETVIDDVASDNLNCRSWYPDVDNNTLVSTNSSINGWWNELYKKVQLANNLINLIEAKGEQTATDRQTEAQARVIRAWLYTRIVGFWGDAPLVVDDNVDELLRTAEADIWAFIVKDLEYAVENAPQWTSQGYASDVAAKALLARVLLTAPSPVQDKVKAAQLAEEVIADGRFVLATDYADIFHSRTSSEIIFAWTNISGDSGAPGWFLRSNLVNNYEAANGAGSAGYGELGRYEFPVDQSLWNAFEPGDNRKAAEVRHLSLNGSDTYDVTKYPSYNAADPQPVSRIAEMYLVSAEAKGYPAGIDRLNQLRASRGLPALVDGTDIKNGDEFLSRIMHERRIEFIAEGLRWYDLRRWWNSGDAGKKAVLALRKYQPGEAAGSRPTASENFNVSDDGHELLWPIPATARANNSALTQNPGY